ncbi:MAG: hypothetical protein K0V04_13745 [Deltaproteobacteria bacterium]|nr:hypothetical protein [Deltaproteobacteria bacterium]
MKRIIAVTVLFAFTAPNVVLANVENFQTIDLYIDGDSIVFGIESTGGSLSDRSVGYVCQLEGVQVLAGVEDFSYIDTYALIATFSGSELKDLGASSSDSFTCYIWPQGGHLDADSVSLEDLHCTHSQCP